MALVIQNLGQFFLYAIVAAFVQNAVLTRGFGVSRLTKLVTDSAVDSLTFCALLCFIQVLSAPLGFLLNRVLEQPVVWYRDYVRPLAFTLAILAAFSVVLLFLPLLKPDSRRDMMATLPMAAFNSAVLGPMLITASQNYGFVQSIGFALGSGLGYTAAVLIVTEGEHKINGKNVPKTFRGLPIKLIYIGILALAIYGLTGHRMAY